ncbi:MAG: hypothetical protein IKL37_00270 [Alphaproteobacteria bacterium]|nr:hypothetical protein [Alphaproteobacteria bacterium]MBR6684682.1 hypothetical protein [Alphaproteobacteria bacterium]
MARNSKSTKGDEYRAVMEKDGIREYKVLAFAFLSDIGPEYFHYELMLADPRPDYYLFDIMGEIAQIIVPKDSDNERLLIELAERCGGKKTTPNTR